MGLFSKATRRKTKLRLAICGTSGSGKTYSALLIAMGLGGKIALIDTEYGSGSLYEHLCNYDTAEIRPPFTVEKYITAINEAEKEGYNVLIIDSLTHAWAGQGGILEQVDKIKSTKKNEFGAWRDVTPLHNKLVDTVLQSQMHVIVTMRTKAAYEIEKNDKGKAVPVKRGMAPIQRDGLEYEFTVVLDIDNDKHIATAGKDRTGLFDGKVFVPDINTGNTLLAWLESGADVIANREQLLSILTQAKQSGLANDDIKQIMELKYGIQSSDKLTMAQAAEMKNNLDIFWEEIVKGKTISNPDDDAILDAALGELQVS